MKSFRKILYLFLIIFTLSFSIDGEKSKVVLDKRYDTAKLKIGVTKLISKELPLEFHAESKKIYGEIDIDENDLVFVSETLDEMPSVSTTNGRKSINNIKKYLTKEIKKSPKFEYRIVEEKPEADKTEGKKYLLIDCKEQLSGVYVYVVEKGSYKVKEVYRGVFRQLFKQQRTVTYGNLHFKSNHNLNPSFSLITFDGKKVNVNKQLIDYAEVESGTQFGYPKKSHYGKLGISTSYRVIVTNLDTSTSKIYPSEDGNRVMGDKYDIINISNIDLENSEGKNAAVLSIKSNEKSEYLELELKVNYFYKDIRYKVEIQYGVHHLISGFEPIHTDSFGIQIDKKERTNLPEATTGEIFITKGEKLWGQDNIFTAVAGNEDKITINDKTPDYLKATGHFLKEIDLDNADFKNSTRILKVEVYNKKGEGQKVVSGETELPLQNKGTSYSINDLILYDTFGMEVGKLNISADHDDNNPYFKMKIFNWKDTAEMLNSRIKVMYIARGEKDVVLKEDTILLYVVPVQENIPADTRGTLLITNPTELAGADLMIDSAGKLIMKENRFHSKFNPDTQAIVSGTLPMAFASNYNNPGEEGNWVNWGEDWRLIINGENISNDYEAYNPSPDAEEKRKKFSYKHGYMTTQHWGVVGDEDGWAILSTQSKEKAGHIMFTYDSDDKTGGIKSLKIGFCAPLFTSNDEIDLHGSMVSSTYIFEYQAKIGGQWITKKKDILDVIIQSSIDNDTPTIELKNPLVYYDYRSSSAISNIVHNKRTHLAGTEAKTLTSGEKNFTKNTDLKSKPWIKIIKNEVPIYYWDRWKEHKISIVQGTEAEVIKTTDEKGRTPSSTFLSGKKTANGIKNEVMLSYDGGNQYLNFGLSRYNFEEETINNIIITNYANKNSSIQNRGDYTIIIPKFEGIHYVNQNYDIKPEQDYVKDYEFNQNKGNKPITIEYGTVGFRDLDIRITKQNDSGLKAEGIEIRAYKDVILKNDAGYTIKGAKLYFAPGQNVGNKGDKITYFKGENEKATYNMLMLDIPNQETLIPKDRFRILRADTEGYPLEVGVTVNGDTTKYYTPIDNEGRENKAAGKNLYLNLSTRRLVKTTIEFENPDLSVKDENGQDAKEINWIKLNKTNYSGGILKTPINNSNLWGRVRGEVIDIPVEWQGKKFENLKLQVFQENADGTEDQKTDDLAVAQQVNFDVPQEMGKHFVMKYKKGNNFIEFSLDKGYKDDIVHDNIVFYIRYMDGDKFLFDQEYTVKFNKRVDYLGDTTLIIKNPAMVAGANNKGKIILRNSGETLGENNNSTFDSIKWFEVQNPINYKLKYPDIKEWTVTKIDGGTRYIDYKILDTGEIEIGIPDIENEFKEFFNLADYKGGKEVEQSFTVSGTDNSKNKKSYRLNIIIEKFDPRYYGKVYPVGNLESANENYNEINETGIGSFDLRKSSEGDVYIDLGTNYRDYSRYMNILEALGNGSIKIGVKNDSDVEVTAKDNGSAPIVKGKVVFKNKKGNDYLSEKIISAIDSAGNSQINAVCPESYPLYLKLTQEEYRKLKPYTTYEIFLNGNQNVLTFQVYGNNTLDKEMIFKKPLSFKTVGPSITIIPEILDFGQIKPKEHSEPLITKSAQAGIKVIIGDYLAKEFTTVLEPETEEIWIYEKSGTGVTKENGEKLKVRSITVTNKTQNGVTADGKQRQDDFIISGVLEVPNKTEPKRAEYGGHVMVNFTINL